jgi:isopenicillin N synthase-like dioxygenase
MTQPIIDFAEPGEKIASEIDAACRTNGCFYIVNHQIKQPSIAALFNASSSFFSLDHQVKESLNSKNSISGRGYFGYFQEKFDKVNPDLKEGFDIGIDYQPDDPYVKAGTPFYGVNSWPDNVPEFKTSMTNYFDEIFSLGCRVLQLVSVSLGKESNYFDKFMAKPMATLRILRYPPDAISAVGAGEHTDFGLLTFVLEKDVEGIEVKDRNNQWNIVTHLPSAIFVNVGDILEMMTKGAYRATPHRVVNKSSSDRYSAVFFLDPDFYAKLPLGLQRNTAGEHILFKNNQL